MYHFLFYIFYEKVGYLIKVDILGIDNFIEQVYIDVYI